MLFGTPPSKISLSLALLESPFPILLPHPYWLLLEAHPYYLTCT